jgi:hypothetical protein
MFDSPVLTTSSIQTIYCFEHRRHTIRSHQTTGLHVPVDRPKHEGDYHVTLADREGSGADAVNSVLSPIMRIAPQPYIIMVCTDVSSTI